MGQPGRRCRHHDGGAVAHGQLEAHLHLALGRQGDRPGGRGRAAVVGQRPVRAPSARQGDGQGLVSPAQVPTLRVVGEGPDLRRLPDLDRRDRGEVVLDGHRHRRLDPGRQDRAQPQPFDQRARLDPAHPVEPHLRVRGLSRTHVPQQGGEPGLPRADLRRDVLARLTVHQHDDRAEDPDVGVQHAFGGRPVADRPHIPRAAGQRLGRGRQHGDQVVQEGLAGLGHGRAPGQRAGGGASGARAGRGIVAHRGGGILLSRALPSFPAQLAGRGRRRCRPRAAAGHQAPVRSLPVERGAAPGQDRGPAPARGRGLDRRAARPRRPLRAPGDRRSRLPQLPPQVLGAGRGGDAPAGRPARRPGARGDPGGRRPRLLRAQRGQADARRPPARHDHRRLPAPGARRPSGTG